MSCGICSVFQNEIIHIHTHFQSASPSRPRADDARARASPGRPHASSHMLALIVSLSSLAYGKQPGERQLEVPRAMPSRRVFCERGSGCPTAGCFWGVELAFERLPGVKQAESGTGGHAPNPTYRGYTQRHHAQRRCASHTTQASSRMPICSPSSLTYMTQRRNRQGNDGTRCRSTIFMDQRRRSLAVEAIMEESRLVDAWRRQWSLGYFHACRGLPSELLGRARPKQRRVEPDPILWLNKERLGRENSQHA